MKSLLVIFAFLLVFPAMAQETPEQTLVNMEHRRLEAIIKKDSATLVKIYDDKYQGVLASGLSVDKARVTDFNLSASPHIQLSIEDVKAFVSGNIGVTMGKQVNKSKSGHVIGQSKFIRVYQKNGDRWTIIRSQGTIVVQE